MAAAGTALVRTDSAANRSVRSCSTSARPDYDILRAALITNRRHDITNLHYDMIRTRKLLAVEAKRKEQLDKKIDAEHIDNYYFRPRVNAARDGAEYSYNGDKVSVFEHLYKEALSDIDKRVKLQSKQSFHENAKMWHGIKEEARDPRVSNSAIRGRQQFRPVWACGPGKRAVTPNPSPWKKREQELQAQQEKEDKESREKAQKRPVSKATLTRLMAPTSSSKRRAVSAPPRRSSPSPVRPQQRQDQKPKEDIKKPPNHH